MTQTPTINYRLPQVEQLLQHPELVDPIARLSRPRVTQIIREQLETIRRSAEFKQLGVDKFDVLGTILKACHRSFLQRQQRVINATGIAMHTNLGRSPITPTLWDRLRDVNTGYCNLELDLNSGKRGGRNGLLPQLVNCWIGAEDCLIVNNNAASVFLVLQALAAGREVVVSRGEQVQIGGGFRIPDILALAGCKLVEVGTTNVTTHEDYLNAINDNTALVLIVHRSNFHIEGFTESADIAEVARRLPKHVHLVVDQGSGYSSERFADTEVSLGRYLEWGAALVCFSGDKILGGPQAGFIAGQKDLIGQLARHPMMRAFRSGRIVLSLLEELLVQKLNQNHEGDGIAARTIQQLPSISAWAELLAIRWQPYAIVLSQTMQVGGGTLPGQYYDCSALALRLPGKVQHHLDALRAQPVPIIGYLNGEQLLLNLATVLDGDRGIFEQQIDAYLQLLDD